MIDSFLLISAAMGIVSSFIALYFVVRVKQAFSALPRLERPWILLGLGVLSLLVAALTVPLNEFSSPLASYFIQVVAAVFAAFFILAAMATMKHAWTIEEGE